MPTSMIRVHTLTKYCSLLLSILLNKSLILNKFSQCIAFLVDNFWYLLSLLKKNNKNGNINNGIGSLKFQFRVANTGNRQ